MASNIVPQQPQFDLFAKLIVMDDSIRRVEVDGTVYFAILDVLEKLSDPDRTRATRKFWSDFKKSPRMRDVSLNLGQLKIPSHKDGKSYQTDCGDYAAVLYVAMSLPDRKANQLRVYVANRLAQLSEPAFRYLMRQQSEGKALNAEEIRYLYEIGHLALPDPESPDEEIGYNR